MMAWIIEERPESMDYLLRDGARKAYFDVYRWLLDNGPLSLPKDPFEALAEMIRAGLRPYKVEGMGLPDFSQPLMLSA